MTQSNAILRYIARRHDLCGKTEDERVRVDVMAEQSMDFRNGIVRLSYNPNFEQLKPDYVEALDGKLKVGESHEFKLKIGACWPELVAAVRSCLPCFVFCRSFPRSWATIRGSPARASPSWTS